jgi:hypothetical protein
LKTGVARPDLYVPKINKAYVELTTPLRLLIDPVAICRSPLLPAWGRRYALLPQSY